MATLAITILCNMPKNSYSAKSVIKNAFGIIPVHEDDYSKLVFSYKSRYYFCKTLPQGAGSSCRIFEHPTPPPPENYTIPPPKISQSQKYVNN